MSVGPLATAATADRIQPFHLAGRPVRGRLVRLSSLAENILTRHDQPPVVSAILGEALALAAALAAGLKFEGSFSIQAKGDGSLPMLLADCTSDGALRGYARTDAGKLAALLAADPAPSAARLLGAGHLAFTCDQGPGMDRYQGIVAIEGASLAEIAHHYFRTSEQIQSAIRLAAGRRADAGGTPRWHAAALILERMPEAGGDGARAAPLDPEGAEEQWRNALVLAGSATEAELLDPDLPPEKLLYRLYHTEGLRLGQAHALSHGCRCTRERIAGLIAGFPATDIDAMVQDGRITVTCEFCNLDFVFTRTEVAGEKPDGAAVAPAPA
ncbi:MAG: Hsp33 family molecular chaperone HslO [Alphaproteobacteria bacterium]|nr:Hsp33 family molecular chaperone HslO [Alphaproteobacteria bacterium]